MLAKVYACAVIGLEGQIVEVEVDHANRGLPSFMLVGLPDAAIKESSERVRAAIKNSGLQFPGHRLTVTSPRLICAKPVPVMICPLPLESWQLLIKFQSNPWRKRWSWVNSASTDRCVTCAACCPLRR